MSLSVLGILHHNDATEYRAPRRTFDPIFLRDAARAYDDHGYDRVLIGQHARSPDPLSIAAYVTSQTQRLKFMIAHRPGFIAPTMAARMFATLDRLSRGRCAAHIITGGSDTETRGDGDFLTKDERYARSREYVGVLREIWRSPVPIDHEGTFYRFRQGFSDVRPAPETPIPIYWGGASEGGIAGGAECADVYAMGGGSLDKVTTLVAAVREAAAARCRRVDFCMSMRIIMAPSEAAAWRRAFEIRDRIVAYRAVGGRIGRDKGDTSVRAVDAAVQEPREPVHGGPDPQLWDGLTLAVQGRTHITSLVGSVEQLTTALLKYHALGIDQFILTGFEPIDDSIAIGRELLPRLQAAAASSGAQLRRPADLIA